MHLGKVFIATTAALYLQKGDSAGHAARLLSSRTASAGHGELFARVAASLKAGGVQACGSVVNATVKEVAATYTKAYVGDVLSHVCYDGTFFHEFPTKEVCLSLTEDLVSEFDGKQDYVSWCKEFEAVTRANGTAANSTGNATTSSPPPVELMNASNATVLQHERRERTDAAAAGNSTRATQSTKPASNSSAATAALARRNGTNATSGDVEHVVRHVKKHKGTKKKKTMSKSSRALKTAEKALKTALKEVKAAENKAAEVKVAVKKAASKAKTAKAKAAKAKNAKAAAASAEAAPAKPAAKEPEAAPAKKEDDDSFAAAFARAKAAKTKAAFAKAAKAAEAAKAAKAAKAATDAD